MVGIFFLGKEYSKYKNDQRARKAASFSYHFDRWVLSEIECDKANSSRVILETLSPRLADQVDKMNKSFSTLRKKELDGTLTVMDRKKYNDNWYKVPAKNRYVLPAKKELNSFSSGASLTLDKASIIKKCTEDGFVVIGGVISAYCENFIYLGKTKFGNAYNTTNVDLMNWDSSKTRLFLSLDDQSLLDYNEVFNTSRSKDHAFMTKAQSKIDNLPSANVSEYMVSSLVKKAFLEMKCMKSISTN